jgi:hypothetical protein
MMLDQLSEKLDSAPKINGQVQPGTCKTDDRADK